MPDSQNNHRCACHAEHIASGQVVLRDLETRSTIVATEGALRIEWRDRSLAWLGDATPLASVMLGEGECHVMPQHGTVFIHAADERGARFIVQTRASHSVLRNTFGSPYGWPFGWLGKLFLRFAGHPKPSGTHPM